MTDEEKKQKARDYAKAYRAMGFGKIADRRYYQRHPEECKAKRRDRYKRRKLSQQTGEDLHA